MGWILQEVNLDNGVNILSDVELIGLSILVGNYEAKVNNKHPRDMTEIELESQVYARAWTKIQSAVQRALGYGH